MTKKEQAIKLRQSGETLDEISSSLIVPKSTLSGWFKGIAIPQTAQHRLSLMKLTHLQTARLLASTSKKIKKEKTLGNLVIANAHLSSCLSDPNVAKITLATLYLCEGTKNRSSITFGNSDPGIISLFITLLRQCYPIDEQKFRCTVQCRNDQDIPDLEFFWSKLTGIQRSQFYKGRVDQRSKGKPSKKLEYKGVCRIDYFSADVFNDVTAVANALTKGR